MTRQRTADSASRPPESADLAPVLERLHAAQEQRGYISEDDLRAIATEAGTSTAELYSSVTSYPRFRLEPSDVVPAVCSGPACLMAGGRGVRDALDNSEETHCLGLCDQPVAVLTADGPRIARGAPSFELDAPDAPEANVGGAESAFFGVDDPFERVPALLKRTPDDIIGAVTDSTLQGRGGAGFPAGRKWAAVRAAPGDRKFVVCNADESEPGTFKDRSILDHQPRRLLAGMVLAAHAGGAQAGVIYLRYEYRTQRERLLREIERLRSDRLLGDGFDIVIRRGAGSYVCGEETALLESLEGKRPVPRDRPPYPTTYGLFGAPTLIQNVETLAAVPAIVDRGPGWFRNAGTPKLYCVSGDVPRPGVFELPMTITARELIGQAGAKEDEVKAFSMGGLSGGLLPASMLDVRLNFEDARRLDAQLGSGALIVLNHSRCLVRITLDAMRFFAGESCGKCFPCRIGTVRLRERLEAAARYDNLDAAEMRDVIELLGTGSACGLGPAAGLLARHLIANFDEELKAHEQGRCPAGVCGRS